MHTEVGLDHEDFTSYPRADELEAVRDRMVWAEELLGEVIRMDDEERNMIGLMRSWFKLVEDARKLLDR
jgi:hypothetical protein